MSASSKNSIVKRKLTAIIVLDIFGFSKFSTASVHYWTLHYHLKKKIEIVPKFSKISSF